MTRIVLAGLLILVMVVNGVPSRAQDGPRRADFMNVSFVPDGDEEQVVDIYLPTVGESPHPTIVMYHGGNPHDGSRFGLRRMALYLADRGYVVVNHEYRTFNDAKFSDEMFDALCGMGWIHAHADEYGIDTERIFTWGESWGGYLSASASYAEATPERIEGCPWDVPDEKDRTAGMIGIYGVISLWNDAYDEMEWAYWGYLADLISEGQLAIANESSELIDIAAIAEEGQDWTPISWIDEDDPSALLLHHMLDANVPVELSQDFAAILLANGVNATLVTFADQFFFPYHGFMQHDEPQSETSQTSLAYVFAFLETLDAGPIVSVN